MYLKITNDTENHHGLQYHDGLIIDPVPFVREGSCCPGGIYFTTPKFICNFLDYGPWVREVTIPEDAEIVKDPQGGKWRASKVILSPRKDLREVETWKWLIECGMGIDDQNEALRTAAINGYLKVVKYLVELGADIHAGNDYIFKQAAAHSQLEVVRYLVEQGVDIHLDNDWVLRHAQLYGNLDVIDFINSFTKEI
jgi:hypothetical protein